ncbi:MAG: TetR/AcrR family transcriptional regulator [Hyphomonadaceae bacterium]
MTKPEKKPERRLRPSARPAKRTPQRKGQAPARRTQAERSAETRGRLLDAAVQLIRLRGADGFATEEVSARAGVSRGAQRHHFPTKNALIVATLEHLRDAMIKNAELQIAASYGPSKILDAVIDDALNFFFGDFFYMTLLLMMSDERNGEARDAARALMRESRLGVERKWEARLQEAGLPPDLTADLLALTLSIMRGFAVRRLILDEGDRYQRLIGVWREMARDYLRARRAQAKAIV